MKKDKEWLKKEVSRLRRETGYIGVQYVEIREVLQSINQLDDPEKVVIPQFVADWWERDDDSVTLYGGLSVGKKSKLFIILNIYEKGLGDFLSRVEDWIDENNSIFLDLVNGKPYEIEKEPLYYVLNKKGFLMMRKYEGEIDTMRISNTLSIDGIGDASNYLLTEKEIKDYDDRYWPFAQPVDETIGIIEEE